MMRDKNSRSATEHSAALAAANATILRHAARALIRNCDTLQLMRASSSGGASSSGTGAAVGDAAAAIGSAHDGSGARISALLCFDEMQVRQQHVVPQIWAASNFTAPNFDKQISTASKCWQRAQALPAFIR
jgi:hypothetical protein